MSLHSCLWTCAVSAQCLCWPLLLADLTCQHIGLRSDADHQSMERWLKSTSFALAHAYRAAPVCALTRCRCSR